MVARPFVLACVLAIVSVQTVAAQDDATISDATDRLNRGEYEQVITNLALLVDTPDTSGTIISTYLKAFLYSGQYNRGLEEAARLIQQQPDNPFVHHLNARLLAATGQYVEASGEYRTAGRLRRNFWENAMDYADLLLTTGELRGANEIASTIMSAYKQAYFKTPETLTVAGRAAVMAGEYRDANEAFRKAHSIDPQNVDNLIYWARIFSDKYNEADAVRTFEDALAVNKNRSEIYTGLAKSSPGFAAQEQYATRALEVNRNDIEALGILGTLHMLDGLFDQARGVLDRALQVNPHSARTLAHLAALALVEGDSERVQRYDEQALSINERPVEYLTTVAEDLALRFRYEDALEYSRRAVTANAGDPRALASYGSNLLRLGRSDEAERYLERAFERDPFNLFVGNMLTLIDSYESFAIRESDHFQLVIHRDEEGVLAPLILEEAEAAYAAFSQKYPYQPEHRIVIEAYNDPDDFAVRIAGIPHLGLLGVAFGDVVAINTPKAQGGRDYNWARTLWHEIAHTMAIGVSDYRVPRWFTEGLAVYEEHQAHPEWAREMQLQLYSALDMDRLHAIEEMGRGFTRPEFPGQVLLSYYHAAKIIEYLVDNHGFTVVTQVLQNLNTGQTIEDALESATGQRLATLNSGVRAYLQAERARLGPVMDNLPDLLASSEVHPLSDPTVASRNPFFNELHSGHKAVEELDDGRAEQHFTRAIEIFPDYIYSGNAYLALADIYRRNGQSSRLIETLEAYLAISDYGAAEARELAGLYLEQGNVVAAVASLRRSLNVDPYDVSTRQQLADLYLGSGQTSNAVRERSAVLALNPVDRADAFYQLARAYHEDNNPTRAKRAVLQALEIAPGFRDAQRLLLTFVDSEL